MKYGAHNRVRARVEAIKKGDITSLIKFDVTQPAEMASGLTTESLDAVETKVGDPTELIVEAIHVLRVKE